MKPELARYRLLQALDLLILELPGDKIELRGPIGGYFVWELSDGGPLMLVAGGSGIVPLMAMIRTRAAAGNDTETRLLYSARTEDDLIYRDELEALRGNGLTVAYTLTDSQPPGWTSYARRVDPEMLAEVAPRPAEQPRFLHLRADAVRRGRSRGARATRPRSASDQDRTLRTHRRGPRWTSKCWMATPSRAYCKKCSQSR